MSLVQKIREVLNPAQKALREKTETDQQRKIVFEAAVKRDGASLPIIVRQALLERGHLNEAPSSAIRYAVEMCDIHRAASRGRLDFKVNTRASEQVKKNASIESVRNDLINELADASDQVELRTTAPVESTPRADRHADQVYEKRARQREATKPELPKD